MPESIRARSTSFVPVDPAKILDKKASWVGVKPAETPRGAPVCFVELRDLPKETASIRVANLSVPGHADFAHAVAVAPERLQETRSPFNNAVTGKYAAVYLEGDDAAKLKWKPGDMLQVYAVDASGQQLAAVDVNSSESFHLEFPEEKSVLVKGGLLQSDQWYYDAQLPSDPMKANGFKYADKVWLRAIDVTPPKPDLSSVALVHDASGKLQIKGRSIGGDVEKVSIFATTQESAAGSSAFRALAVAVHSDVGQGGVFTLQGQGTSIANGTELTLCFSDVNGKGCFQDFVVDASVQNGMRPTGGLYTTRMLGNSLSKIPFSR